ncbi:MAG: hypothetical protein ACRDHL_01365, partial [Candidatus Promineifilaceae bacterium]
APAWAGAAQAWSDPLAITPPANLIGSPDMMVDEQGWLHVAYTQAIGPQAGVYYLRSSDDGDAWQAPISAYSAGRQDRMLDHVRLAAASGALHLAWVEYAFPETFPPLALVYQRSTDQGLTWAGLTRHEGPFDFPGLLATPDGDVHLAWSGTAESRQKYHGWSADAGRTWTAPVVTLNVGGLQGWPALGVDGAGEVHLLQVSSGQSGNAGQEQLFYQRWQGAGWSEPISILGRLPAAPNHPLSPDLVINQGNRLHATLAHYVRTGGVWNYEVYAFGLQTGAAHAPATVELPTPQGLATSAAGIRQVPNANPLPTDGPTRPVVSDLGSPPVSGLDLGLWAGVLASAAVIVGAVLLATRQRH